MARENIDRLVDPGSFRNTGRSSSRDSTAQHHRGACARTRGRRRGRRHGHHQRHALRRDALPRVVVHYDYTVLAGTQGHRNHYKQDRIFELAQRFKLPIVLFGEGGGGRRERTTSAPAWRSTTHTFTRSRS